MHNEPTVKGLKVKVLQLQLQIKELEGALLQYQVIDLQEAQNAAMVDYQAEHDAELASQMEPNPTPVDPAVSYGDGN